MYPIVGGLGAAEGLPAFEPFSLYDQTRSEAALEGGANEQFARALHESYRS